jgi:hypothetical protein
MSRRIIDRKTVTLSSSVMASSKSIPVFSPGAQKKRNKELDPVADYRV